MVHDDDDGNGMSDLTNRKMLQILMQEIADVRRELKEDIAAVDLKIGAVDHRLSQKIDTLSSEMKSLRLEVHQNQSTFIQNHIDLERRVAVLEAAA